RSSTARRHGCGNSWTRAGERLPTGTPQRRRRRSPMTDELDTLRSFRPEATGPTDALTTEGRNTLMTAIDAERLPRPARRRRRFVRVALGLAAALVAVGSVAAAAGLIPDDVRQSLGLASDVDPALAPNVDEAVQRASAASPDGGTVELWTAPTNGGGTCAYL